MDIRMKINRVSIHPTEVDVVYDGEHARAVLPQMHVELHDAERGVHGSIELRFRAKAEIAAASDVFTQGETVILSFVKAEQTGAEVPVVDTNLSGEHEAQEAQPAA